MKSPRQITKFMLLGIAATLTLIQFKLIWNHGQFKGLEPYFLCYASVAYLVWKKRNNLYLKTTIAAASVGSCCIAFVLLKTASLSSYDSFLRLAPILSGLGLALLASGFLQLKHYWRELLILCSLLIPTTRVLEIFDISKLTADFTSSFLWYLGYSVSQQGTTIFLPTSSIDVYSGCSGAQSILQLLTLAFLFIMLFPLNLWQKLIVPIVAVGVGFVVNGVRVALMAILFAQANETAFNYWHLGDGSLIFSMIAVLLFGGVCHILSESTDADEEGSWKN